jgi:ABC-type multidrug transport system ATPase subunit
MTLALEANQLGKKYSKRWALQNCDLHIPEGGVTGLVGLNGAGKTTLLHLGCLVLVRTLGLGLRLDRWCWVLAVSGLN